MSFDFKKLGEGDSDLTLGAAIARAWGIPLRRKKVELRKAADIPALIPNRADRRRAKRGSR